jgi:hypothetical protein
MRYPMEALTMEALTPSPTEDLPQSYYEQWLRNVMDELIHHIPQPLLVVGLGKLI